MPSFSFPEMVSSGGVRRQGFAVAPRVPSARPLQSVSRTVSTYLINMEATISHLRLTPVVGFR